MTLLDVRGVTKRFGALKAVDGVTFQVASGQICGFIGPNGAGKTTTMRVCSTLELPDEGDVLIDGLSVLGEPREARKRIGFMPDSYGAYANTTIDEYLDFYARAYGLQGAARRATLARVIEFTSLGDLTEKYIDALSKGMKQRLCLAKTLLHDPPVMILDEPAAGLDPRARVELRELVKALAQLGKAILVSSHILTELSEMCSSVVVIERGQLKGGGTVADVVRSVNRGTTLFLRALAGPEACERRLLETPHVLNVRREHEGVVFEFDGDLNAQAELFALLAASGLQPLELALRDTNLEDIFLSLTEGKLQ